MLIFSKWRGIGMRKGSVVDVASMLFSCGSSHESLSTSNSIGLPGLASASNSLLWLQGDSFNYGACPICQHVLRHKFHYDGRQTSCYRYLYQSVSIQKEKFQNDLL
jgi:hypothetical protein